MVEIDTLKRSERVPALPSVTDAFPTDRRTAFDTGPALSSVRIWTLAVLRRRTAPPCGLASWTLKVSLGSRSRSPFTGIETTVDVEPAANVTVPALVDEVGWRGRGVRWTVAYCTVIGVGDGLESVTVARTKRVFAWPSTIDAFPIDTCRQRWPR